MGRDVAALGKASMRFDDMLATVLAQPQETVAERVAVWRQLVDLLAQRDDIAASPDHIEAFALFDDWRPEIPDAVRMDASAGLSGRKITPWLMASFAEEKPEIARPAVLGAHIETQEWEELLPIMRPSSRALLRHRSDLPESVRSLLSQYGAADMILETTAKVTDAADPLELSAEQIVPAAPEPDREQIRNLVERIEAYRREKDAAPAPQKETARLAEFRFEAGSEGTIHWVEGAPRGPLIGQTIAFSADALDAGVDGHAAGAFRHRAPFRDARLVVAGNGPASGDWRISAVPFFTESDGRFAGYRGMARRPKQGEDAARANVEQEGLFGSTLAPDSIRQLLHELRTPLNAIAGFSAMIEQQLLGPVSESHRGHAAAISHEASKLLESLDDLDAAARSETDRLALDPQQVDGASVLQRLHDAYAGQASSQGAELVIRIEEGMEPLAIDPSAAERMIERLLSATIGLATGDEIITVSYGPGQTIDRAVMRFARPQALAGLGEDELLDPGYSLDGDWPDAPALGLGFALRLIRNIAQDADGQLEIDEDSFALYLPVKDASALSGERGNQ